MSKSKPLPPPANSNFNWKKDINLLSKLGKSKDLSDIATFYFISLKNFNSSSCVVVKQKAFFNAAFLRMLNAISEMSIHKIYSYGTFKQIAKDNHQ